MNYETWKNLSETEKHANRDWSDLTEQLKGLEGWRVEVMTDYGETRRFIVGRSTGWKPIHIEVARRDSHGGPGAERHYRRVRKLYKVDKMAREISNHEDVIDSRDVIERIEELEDELSDAATKVEEYDELNAEIISLKKLAEQGETCSDWHWGEALIRDDYFETYARELAEDCDALDKNAGWPNRCIDWERAANELQQDYTAVDFDGVTYWLRG